MEVKIEAAHQPLLKRR